jgi:hypothetical protein
VRKPSIRRSDRVALEVPIQVSGTASMGRELMFSTRTLLLSRYGAKIILDDELVPHPPFSVFCPETNQEAEARYVGSVRQESAGLAAGIEFLDATVNLWNIEFPPLSKSTQAVARLLLECPSCGSVGVSYLNEIEARVLDSKGFLPRLCKSCNAMTTWRPSQGIASGKQLPLPAALLLATKPVSERPLRASSSLQFTVCVRHRQLGEEVGTAEKASRGGFRLKSRKGYWVEDVVDVAVPYLQESGNIFVPARIARAQDAPEEGITEYSVSYIPTHQGWAKLRG